VVECTGFTRAPDGSIEEVRCHYDPDSRGGDARGRKVRGTIHWVSAQHAVDAEVRLYDTLFAVPKPDDADDFKTALNPTSLEVLPDAKVEPALASVAPETRLQFERQGYFVADWKDHTSARPVFNRTVGLRDTWAKVEKNSAQP
jgi:glutaminyl-tRNA synthetase